jgi:SET domain-containing protein
MKMNAKRFLASLNDAYTRLGPSARGGVGIFAIRNIPKGTDPFKYCDPFGGVLLISDDELVRADAPEEVKRMVRDFCALQNGNYHVPDYGIDAIDKSYYLNHSDRPNLTTRDKGETFVAARAIRKGEELTADYRRYHEVRREFVAK